MFQPKLDPLPPAQRAIWPLLVEIPRHFVLYGGTAVALRLGHRISVDFDFFSAESFRPDATWKKPSAGCAKPCRFAGRKCRSARCDLAEGRRSRAGVAGLVTVLPLLITMCPLGRTMR
ncbi:MAG: hypothetical protein EXS37_02040 [Opitutus sp.]|nr:hypothetical protein [Opitutus sp.]